MAMCERKKAQRSKMGATDSQFSDELCDLWSRTRSPPPRTDGRIISAKMPSFRVFDAVFMAVSMVTFVVDIGTDINLVVHYLLDGYYMWGGLTLALVMVPAIIVMLFSLRWHILDDQEIISAWHWVAHICLWGILQRYIFMFRTGIKAKKTGDPQLYYLLYSQQSDVCMLRMFESFLESAPQLVLQLYIMMSYQDYSAWTAITALSSMISLGWGVASYAKANRITRPDKHKMTLAGLAIQTTWRVGTIGSRVAALALVATVLQGWILVVMALHLSLMFTWVLLQKTSFTTTWWEEKIYNFVMAIIYCFCFFNLKEGQARWRMLSFYTLTFGENVIFSLLYFYLSNHQMWLKITALAIVYAGMTTGLICMLFYYRYFHPVGPLDPMKNWFGKQQNPTEESQGTPVGCRPVDIVDWSGMRTFKYQNSIAGHTGLSPSSLHMGGEGISLKSSPASVATETSSTSHTCLYTTTRGRSEVVCSVQDLLANMSVCNESPVEGNQLQLLESPSSRFTSPRNCGGSLERSVTRELNSRLATLDRKSEIAFVENKLKRTSELASDNRQFHRLGSLGSRPLSSQTSSPNSVGVPVPQLSAGIHHTLPREWRSSKYANNSMQDPVPPNLNGACVSTTCNLLHPEPYEYQPTSPALVGPNVELAVIDVMQIIEVESTDSSNVSNVSKGDYENVFELTEESVNMSRHLPPKPAQSSVSLDITTLEVMKRESLAALGTSHDYENVCAVNINRAMAGVRHWRTYSNIIDRGHDYSTCRERFQALDSTGFSCCECSNNLRYSCSRRGSLAEECESAMSRSLPDLSVLRLETFLEEAEEGSTAEKTPYIGVNDDPRLMAVLERLRATSHLNKASSADDIPNYETIWVGDVQGGIVPCGERMEGHFSRGRQASHSSLVATIDDVQTKESLCNLYYSTTSDLSSLRKNFSMGSLLVAGNSQCHSHHSKCPGHVRESSRLTRAISVPDNGITSTTQSTLAVNPVKAVAEDVCRPRRKFSLLRERFEPTSPYCTTSGKVRDSSRRNSFQDRTARALQAGMKVFRRPRIHVITPKKGEEGLCGQGGKETPTSRLLRSPFRSKTNTSNPMTPVIKITPTNKPTRMEIDAAKMAEDMKNVIVHITPKLSAHVNNGCRSQQPISELLNQTAILSRLQQLTQTPKSSTPKSFKDLDDLHNSPGPKTSTPEGGKSLPQISILSAVSSVVPSPEGRFDTARFISTRIPLMENRTAHYFSSTRSLVAHRLPTCDGENSPVASRASSVRFAPATSVPSLNSMPSPPPMFSGSLGLPQMETAEHSSAGLGVLSQPTSPINVSVSSRISTSEFFHRNKSTLSPNSKIFTTRI